MELKLALAEKLLEEKNRLPEYSVFGDKTNYKDYDLAIEFLRNGNFPSNYADYPILNGCIEDINLIFSDYGLI